MRRASWAGACGALILLAGGAPAGAEETSTKRELALELLRVSGGEDMAQQLSQVFLASMQQSYAGMVQQHIASQPDLSHEERLAVEERLGDYGRFAESFNDRVNREIDFAGVLEEVYVPLYEQYFSEPELRAIVEFQSSPVGQKALSVMPQLTQEGLAATLPMIQPQIMGIAEEVMREEQAIALAEE